LAGCTLFTKFNIQWGYNNIWIKPGDKWKAAFLMPEGLFEPTVMFFRLTNSPATFQMIMNTIFRREVQEGWFSIFMDNNIIYTKKNPGEMDEQHTKQHRTLVHCIFDILKANDLYIKPEKCTFKQHKIKYLGVIIGKGHLKMDPKMLKGVADYMQPKNPTEVCTFLSFTGYYWYFIQGYLQIAQPLLDLTKKLETWHWGDTQEKAFQTLKDKMCSAPILLQPDFNKKFYLQTDTSAYGVGAVLSQEGGTGPANPAKPKLHPVAYYSVTFTPMERNYDIYECKLLAIMKALAH
jgi:RNase H-like domain found in reverse transcriptase/Reverse transcriptase (RNA-dependent DNA polymerase)